MSTTSTTSSANATPTVDASNFATSLFSDLSPLLTLFGDEVTKQFLSTSMGWADCILLSTAPLGIITIVVSAIRVSGTPLLKAVIGRARDSPADEEKDILSSTSTEVREIWDGNRVIRQTGASYTTEIVYSTEREINPGDGAKWPIWTRTLVSAIGASHLPSYREKQPPYRLCGYKFQQGFAQRHRSLDPEDVLAVSKLRGAEGYVSGKAPNLILNIPKIIPTRSIAWMWVFIGLMVQLVVFVVNGLGVFHYRWTRSRYKVASYGFPVWVIGTLLMTLGVCICAKVVETNTVEYTARPAKGAEDGQAELRPRFHVVRLQKAIDAMKLPPFAIYNVSNDPDVHISARGLFPFGRVRNSRHYKTMAAWTIAGSFFALSGFILQNIGTRELHWSAAVAQLVATLILALIRAWIRRHVGDAPLDTKTLRAGFEAVELACHMYQVDSLMIYGGNICLHPPFRQPKGPSGEIFELIAKTPPPNEHPLNSHGVEEPHVLDVDGSGTDMSRHRVGLTAVQRVCQSQSVLVEVQPDSFNTKEVAEQMQRAIAEILMLLSLPIITWEQRVFFRGQTEFGSCLKMESDKLEGLVNMPLTVSIAMDHDAFCGPVQSLLNLTMYPFSLLGVFSSGVIFHVLTFCPIAEEYDQEWEKKKAILGYYDGRMDIWIRTPDGRTDQEVSLSDTPQTLDSAIWEAKEDAVRRPHNHVVFGMSYSAMKFDPRGEPYVESGKAVELYLEKDCDSQEDAIKAVQRELIMNFLHQLVGRHPTMVKALLDSSTSTMVTFPSRWRLTRRVFQNTLFNSMADVLVKHKLEDDKILAARLVAAAFLAHDLFPPIPDGLFPAEPMPLHNSERPESAYASAPVPTPAATPGEPATPTPIPSPSPHPQEAPLDGNASAVRRRALVGGGGAEASDLPGDRC